jgi:cell division protein FtsI/penicillin-binding protein 2
LALAGAWLAASAAAEPGVAQPVPLSPKPSAPKLDLSALHGPLSTASATKQLTINTTLQDTANQLLDAARPMWGGVVMTEIKTGKILVWSQFNRQGAPHYQQLATRLLPSASLFKLVTTSALLEETPVTVRTRVCVAGGDHAIERRHLEVPRTGEIRCLPFFDVLGHSVNAAYAQLVTRHLARNDLLTLIERLGLNRPLPFDADARLGAATVPYEDLAFARTAAGFEQTSFTVLGTAFLTHAIAMEGRAPELHLLDVTPNPGPKTSASKKPARLLRATTARRLARMMEVTVHSGTALEAFTDPKTGMSYLADLRVAGKTGTLHKGGSTVSWFTGFAPARAPQVVVTVALENSQTWRQKAAEVARDLLRARFAKHRGITPPLDREALRLSPRE